MDLVILNYGQMMRTTPQSTNFRASSAEGHLTPTDLTCSKPAYTANLRWNRASKLTPYYPVSKMSTNRMSAVLFDRLGDERKSKFVRWKVQQRTHHAIFV
ncbi:hypothetical protein AVEN_29419-1 [Araneus ventricosus]|uniref:Uncharacterized protein n=1 Tax=Araneus ventricosus TaxID=182803 RepID=A0A4Y2D0R7_ARAVE|nr:hypothetical protein AVEN_29419-1 [Araneus ventricosus]